MVFNTVGNFGYISPDIDQEAVQKGFVMKGDVKVIDQPNVLNSSANNTVIGSSAITTPSIDEATQAAATTTTTLSPATSNNNIETVGVFMVPTKDIDEYVQDFKNNGFSIDSTYSFKDLRGLARDTGSEQTLLVWTAGPTMTVDTAISALKDIGEKLPYK
jgi:hypothetical protein